VPRFGYRWVGPIEGAAPARRDAPATAVLLEAPTASTTRPSPSSPPPDALPPAAPHRGGAWRAASLALASSAVLLLGVAAVAWWRARPPAPVAMPASAPAAPALVLPAEVAAPEPWRWLRLGVMDLVATRLRDGSLPTLSSESVVGLLARRGAASGEALLDDGALAQVATLRVLPQVTFADGRWHVRLDAHGAQRTARAEAEGADAIQAAAAATDALLRKLGRAPGGVGTPPSSPALEELMQRSGAAMLADQLGQARGLIEAAPPALQDEPRVQERLAQLDLRAGDYAAVDRRLHAALDRVGAQADPALRARMLVTLAAAALRANQPERAAPLYEEAIALRREARDPELLGVAHLGRGAVLALASRYDAATAAFARARIELEGAGDALGVASVDVNLGDLQLQRGRMADASARLADAAREFERLGAREGLAHALSQQSRAQREMLDFAGALATTGRFWPPEAHTSNRRLRWTLSVARAGALAGSGRPEEAADLLGRIRLQADPGADALALAQAEALSATLAARAGDAAAASAHAAGALVPVLRAADPPTWARAALLRIRSLAKAGDGAQAADVVAALHACAEEGDPACRLYATLADAGSAWTEGRREAALESYAVALRLAGGMDVPEDLVASASAAVDALVAASQLDGAREAAGRIAPWSRRDPRAASAQAVLFRALGDADAARAAEDTAAGLLRSGRVAAIGPAPGADGSSAR
jgi:tetratricopeptide (TPR) repeat protein